MGAAVSGAEQGGRRCPDLREDFSGIGLGGHDIWVGDVGYDTAYREVLGRIPPLGGPQSDREKNSESKGWYMGVPPSVGSDDGGGITGGGYLHIPPLEHSHTVHCNQDHYGPISGGGAESGVKGVQAVVGAGWLGIGGDADGGLGGGTDREGRGYGRRRIKLVGKIL